jgi:hypothetical protein
MADVTFDRRALLATGLALTAAPSVGTAKGRRAVFRNGLGASQFAGKMLEDGYVFKDGRRTARSLVELQRLYMARGGNEVFARTGTARHLPEARRNGGPQAVIARARLARSLGLPLNPELLLCGVYGDVGLQPEPDFSGYPEIRLRAPWAELTIDEMADALRIYGELAAREILATGVEVNVWDIGNEIEFGLAGVALPPMTPRVRGVESWTYRPPDAVDPAIGKLTLSKFYVMKSSDQVAWCKTHLWPHVGRMLAAVAEGIRKVDPRAKFATHVSAVASLMPHIFVGFYEAMEAAGFHCDELGVSYYPTNTKAISNRLERFKSTALQARNALGKPLYIAEYAYAAAPVTYGGDNWANPVDGYPISAEGQGRFLRDLVAWGASSGAISGIRPWAPDYVDGGWAGMALFEAASDKVAIARPALSAIQDGLALGRRA